MRDGATCTYSRAARPVTPYATMSISAGAAPTSSVRISRIVATLSSMATVPRATPPDDVVRCYREAAGGAQ